MLVYGRNVCEELLKNKLKINKIFLQDNYDDKKIISLIEKNNLSYKYLSKQKMDSLCNGVHQGIIFDVPDYNYSKLEDIINDEIIVILDHLEDPHNFGAIVRTCEAAGIKSIIIPNDRSVSVNGTVCKTSVGTIFNTNIVKVVNLVNTIKELKDNGYWIVGTSLDTNIDYKDIDYSGKMCLIIGNEGSGISNLVAKNCDYLTKIPMYGTTNSLNASVAAGIMIYEMIRNRK